MARKRPERKNAKLIKGILESYQPETTQDIQEALKDFIKSYETWKFNFNVQDYTKSVRLIYDSHRIYNKIKFLL